MGVANSDMLTSGVYKRSTDAASQHSAEVPAGCGFARHDARPVLFSPPTPTSPPRAPEEVSLGPFPRELPGSHGGLPEEQLRER